MKELKLYQCEICGTQYKSKVDCKNCESSHIKPVKVSGAKWNAKNVGCTDGYPVKVTVTFEDGKTADYRR